MPVPNLPSIVAVTDTFEEWRLKTNSIITALTNDTILLTELPSIAANTILGNSSSIAAATPNTITVLSSNGITMIDGVLKLFTPTGGITLTNTGALSLATAVAGAGLALNSGVLSIPLTTTGSGTPTSNSGLKFVTAAAAIGSMAQINAGLGVSLLANGGITLTGGALALVTPTGGITLTGGALALATTVAGAGLALNSGVLSALSIPLTTAGGFDPHVITGTNAANSSIIILTIAISSLEIMNSFIGRGITGKTTGSGIPSLTYITAINGISVGSTVTLSANIAIANTTARLFYVYLFNNSSGLKFVAASTGVDLIPESQITAGLGIKVNSDKGLEIVDAGLGIKVINDSSLIVNNMGLSISLTALSLIVSAIITNNKVTYTSNTWGLVAPATYVTSTWLGTLVPNRRGCNLSPYSTLQAFDAGIQWTRSVSGGIATVLALPGFVIACLTNAPKIAITIKFSGRARGGNNYNNFGYLYLSRVIYSPGLIVLSSHSSLAINGSEGFYQINESSGAYYETTIYDILPSAAVIGSNVLYILSYLADNWGWNVNETNDGQRGFHLFDSTRNQANLRHDNFTTQKLSFIMLEIPTVNVIL